MAQRPSPQRQELIERYIPLARRIARGMARRLPPGVEPDDLVGAAFTGLVDAVDRYDPSRPVAFGTYAKHRIRGAVLDALRADDWVPRSVRTRAARIDRARRRLEHTLGRAPQRNEMARALEVSLPRYSRMLEESMIRVVVPLSDGSPDEARQPLPASTEPDPLEVRLKGEQRERMLEALQELPERHRQAVALYYLHGLSLKEVGEVLGVTESRACQLCGEGVRRLRARLDPSAGL